jgi:hypothetical protein
VSFMPRRHTPRGKSPRYTLDRGVGRGSSFGLDTVKRINGTNVRVILKWAVNKFGVRVWTQFIVVGFCEDGYEPSHNIKFKKFVDQLRDSHLKWVPCHHGMARPQVADGGDGVQICSCNKQSRTADEGWSSVWGVGREGKTTHHKTSLLTKCHKGARTWTNSLERLKIKKMDMRFGTYYGLDLSGSG